MMKSFEQDRSLNPRVKYVLVSDCLTEEAKTRILQGDMVNHLFVLSEVLANSRTQAKFTNLIVRAVTTQ